MTIGEALSTLGIAAQGDLTGVGGAGGFATSVGFSGTPLSTSPLPDPRTPGLGTKGGAGDAGFSGTPFSL